MLEAITNLAGTILKPVADLVDNLHTSDEERGKIKLAADQVAASITAKLIELEARVLESQHKVQLAELAQDDKITKRWRPYVGYLLGTAIGINLIAPPLLGFIKPGVSIPAADPYIVGIAAALLGVGQIGRSIEKKARTALGASAAG